ncbi:hypothetical protein [Buchananella felis]|uniref:hypothetical protein n=1 Tax=Buchananella felis TaxID=3231492 RepID=UPI003529CA4D
MSNALESQVPRESKGDTFAKWGPIFFSSALILVGLLIKGQIDGPYRIIGSALIVGGILLFLPGLLVREFCRFMKMLIGGLFTPFVVSIGFTLVLILSESFPADEIVEKVFGSSLSATLLAVALVFVTACSKVLVEAILQSVWHRGICSTE